MEYEEITKLVIIRNYWPFKGCHNFHCDPICWLFNNISEAIKPYLGGLGGALLEENSDCCSGFFDFETKLHLIYLGAICIGIGTIFYRIFAHHIVKKYRDANDYIRSELNFLTSECIRQIFKNIRNIDSIDTEGFLKIAPWLCSTTIGIKSASDAYEQNRAITESGVWTRSDSAPH